MVRHAFFTVSLDSYGVLHEVFKVVYCLTHGFPSSLLVLGRCIKGL